jgi:carboxymethylenebutenolidase
MTERVTFHAKPGAVEGALAFPQGKGRFPAVVVVQEWWGVNAQIESICERWAKEGFIALAPDLYHGVVVPIGKADEAGAAMGKLDFGKAVQELAGAIEYVKMHPRCSGKVALTGYCMGGALSLATAAAVPGLAAVVPFYGMPPAADWAKVDAPVQAHFAQHDDWATVAGAQKIQAALAAHGKVMDLHVYDAQHAFCNDLRPEVYSAEAASQAWGRAVAFVRQHTA